MGYANKLYNPTPWDTKWEYSRGIVLYIPAFGELQLENIQMVDDFRPDKPGAENVQMNMATLGFFLYDPNKSYDSQALLCIQGMKRELSERLRTSTQSLRSMMAASNMQVDGEPFEEILRQHGLDLVKNKIKILESLEKQYESAVKVYGSSVEERGFDPERTVFAIDPPREFPSKAAMSAFLGLPENKTIKKAHDEYQARLATASMPKRKKVEDEATIQS